ncbi:OLC1v1035963C4 [Oldenlandia corymbosa var. corymbosa]|uniref:OLC1v1035963C4 n=1 Tax=Oldenlandia corymbosa var. corymbosa TaxID=529605 RepID=A0AAV1CU95_OLDCO|nr:OLC1v1035963C4 [Oldenlandia corymbosa var. corymbosa]
MRFPLYKSLSSLPTNKHQHLDLSLHRVENPKKKLRKSSNPKKNQFMASSAIVAPEISRTDFPEDFIFGAATAAFQVEGAAAEDGRAPSLWDTFTVQEPKNVKDGSNANVAVDQYHRYKEDVKIMKKMGLDAYRFSISWPRVLPGGRLSAGINKKGIEYYNNLIDELLANGIEPYATLFHWDVPQALESEYGGFLDRKIVDDFREFADLCFWEFGDRVKNWMTLNEPWTFAVMGYTGQGTAPGRGVVKSVDESEHVKDPVPKHKCHRRHYDDADENGDPGTEPYIVTHNLLLAHAAAVKLYRENFKCQGGKIGITLVSQWWEPLNNTPEDREAVDRQADFMFGWYMSPITFGHYPDRMREIVQDRLPTFTKDESQMLRGSFDFLGLNYYTGRYATDISDEPISVVSYNTDAMVKTLVNGADGKEIGEQAGSEWLRVFPLGMLHLLRYIKARYNNPVVYITENGYDEVNDPKLTIAEARRDVKRIQYHHDHLKYVKQAMDEKVNVQGYFIWSFIDNYEWQEGYTVRYGTIYVDYRNGYARYPKWSALWFMNFLSKAGGDKQQIPAGAKRPIANNGEYWSEYTFERPTKRRGFA